MRQRLNEKKAKFIIKKINHEYTRIAKKCCILEAWNRPPWTCHERIRYDSRSNMLPSESYLIIHKNYYILFLMKDALKMMYGVWFLKTSPTAAESKYFGSTIGKLT